MADKIGEVQDSPAARTVEETQVRRNESKAKAITVGNKAVKALADCLQELEGFDGTLHVKGLRSSLAFCMGQLQRSVRSAEQG